MRSPRVALCVVAAAGAVLVVPAIPAAQGQTAWQTCRFNGRPEACLFAGGSSSFTITFRSDGKQIQMEKVGEPWTCGQGGPGGMRQAADHRAQQWPHHPGHLPAERLGHPGAQ